MAEVNNKDGFFRELQRELSDLWHSLGDGWRTAGANFRNWMRRARRMRLDYVVMPLEGSLPQRAAPPRSFIGRRLFPPGPLSFEQLNGRFQAIADADNVKGVVLLFRGFTAGPATIQNLRRSIQRLRAAGKQVVVYTPYLDLTHYYAASAADRIVIPPSTTFDVLGLRTEVAFFKDALAQVGIHADVVQISPYKTAFDPFVQSELTPQHREQLEWLLDDQYDCITSDMANGRSLSHAAMQSLIDQAPLGSEEALAHGLVDAVAFEDELASLLAKAPPADETAGAAPAHSADEAAMAHRAAEKDGGETAVSPPEAFPDDAKPARRPRARMRAWSDGRALLHEKPRRRTRKFIGVLSLEGAINMGPSRRPPIDLPIPLVGGAMIGEQTVARILRRIARLDRMAALIIHVDSVGGSALASELIGREVERVSAVKPVLVYMGDVAASGGYYVAAPARHIMSQAGTLTGSIGVVVLRPSTQGLYDKIAVNRVSLERGRHAALYSDLAPLSDEERQIFRRRVVDSYDRFKRVVANGRNLLYDELDPLCEGRVWTGRQALERRLVDSHGDFVDAVHKAAEMGGLPLDDEHSISVVNIYAARDGYVLPPNLPTAEEITRWLSADWLRELNGRELWMLPYEIRFK